MNMKKVKSLTIAEDNDMDLTIRIIPNDAE